MSLAGRATACSAGYTSRCPWASCTHSSCAQRCCYAGALSGTAVLVQCWSLCLQRNPGPASVAASRPCHSHAAVPKGHAWPCSCGGWRCHGPQSTSLQQCAGRSPSLMARLERCMTSDFVRGLTIRLRGCAGPQKRHGPHVGFQKLPARLQVPGGQPDRLTSTLAAHHLPANSEESS